VTDLLNDLILADASGNSLTLSSGARPALEAALTHALVDPERLNGHVRLLQKQLGDRFRHRELLDEATNEAVLRGGLALLDDTSLARLALNPVALAALADEIEERQPAAWADALREDGLELLRVHGRTVPPLDELLSQRKPQAVRSVGQGIGIAELWDSCDPHVWEQALERYWHLLKPANLDLERKLDVLELSRIRNMDAEGWYDFLRNEYFRWKYTDPRRYAKNTRHLREYAESGTLDELDHIKERLLAADPTDIRASLVIAEEIKGLGVAGASGLLALMYPESFGTVDQFAVKALREVKSLPPLEVAALAKMKPEQLTIKDAILLIGIMRRKAEENKRRFATTAWTPRKIDKILWTYGR
jgi:hypothetical protein